MKFSEKAKYMFSFIFWELMLSITTLFFGNFLLVCLAVFILFLKICIFYI